MLMGRNAWLMGSWVVLCLAVTGTGLSNPALAAPPRSGPRVAPGTEPGQDGEAAVLRRAHLPPRDPRLHDPGGLPEGRRHGRPRLHDPRRTAPAPPLPARRRLDVPRRPAEQHRQPVLYPP